VTPIESERAAMLREFIHERCGFIRAQAEVFQRFCELSDDAGIAYMLQCLGSECKFGITAGMELEALRLKSKEAA